MFYHIANGAGESFSNSVAVALNTKCTGYFVGTQSILLVLWQLDKQKKGIRSEEKYNLIHFKFEIIIVNFYFEHLLRPYEF
jgi:hypothetical protein